jgi:uncharacterized membrane protein YtjA (UPF0391 family)
MFGWAITLLIIAVVAAILGFGGIAGALVDIAIIIFVLALVGSLLLFLLGWKGAKSISRKL